MTLDRLRKMIQDVASSGKTPMTIILTVEDANSLHLPAWSRQLFGLKVVIASNFTESKVVPHVYETITMKIPHKEDCH